MTTWPEYLKRESLFVNVVRLQYLIWTIQQYIGPDARLLEVGFGSGMTAILLSDLGYHVTAVDINKDLVERTCQRYSDWVRAGRLEIQQADMLSLPWRSREFDLAYHQGVLEHFPDDLIVQTLREQARVARWVIFDVPNYRCRVKWFGDERLLAPAHWRRLLAQAGLEIVDERGRGFDRWLYVLPFGLFSRFGLNKLPWFSRLFAVNSIFVCRPVQE